jgi:hypothetical protein
MGVLDGALGSVAQNLLGTFGRSATLKRPGTAGTYNASTGTYSGGAAATEVSCSVVFSDFNVTQIDGTMVKLGDRKALVSRVALGAEPVPGKDTLVVDGATWEIVRVVGYSSGEQEAAFEMQVRR